MGLLTLPERAAVGKVMAGSTWMSVLERILCNFTVAATWKSSAEGTEIRGAVQQLQL